MSFRYVNFCIMNQTHNTLLLRVGVIINEIGKQTIVNLVLIGCFILLALYYTELSLVNDSF